MVAGPLDQYESPARQRNTLPKTERSAAADPLQASEAPVYSARGTLTANFVRVLVDRKEVEGWLPRALTLDSTADKVPVVMIFGQNANVGDTDPNGWFARKIGEWNYNEFMVIVPGVRHRRRPQETFNYLPHLSVDHRGAKISGNLVYGLPKRMATIARDNTSTYTIDHRRLRRGNDLEASFKSSGAPKPMSDLSEAREIRELLSRDWVVNPPWGTWRRCRFQFDWEENTEVRPVTGSAKTSGWFARRSALHQSNGSELTGFHARVGWKFTLPRPL